MKKIMYFAVIAAFMSAAVVTVAIEPAKAASIGELIQRRDRTDAEADRKQGIYEQAKKSGADKETLDRLGRDAATARDVAEKAQQDLDRANAAQKK